MANTTQSYYSAIPPPKDNDGNDDNQKKDECIHVVLVGGGHAHVYVLKKLRSYLLETNHLPKKQIQCTLLTRDVQTPYSGMLPGFVAGHYTYDQIHINLQALCNGGSDTNSVDTPQIRLIHGSATQITYNNDGSGGGHVHYQPHSTMDDQPPNMLKYDILSIDIGSTPSGMPPQKDGVTPVKPISNFATNYQRLKDRFILQSSSFSVENPFILLIVGGGAGGIELALAAQHNLQQEYLCHLQTISRKPNDNENDDDKTIATSIIQTIIVTKGTTLLPQHNVSVRHRMERILNERNIQVYTGVQATDIRYPMEEDNLDNDEEDNNDDSTSPLSFKTKEEKKKQLVYVQPSSSTEQSQHAPTIVFDECLWCTSAGAASWLSDNTPFATDESGGNFIQVKDTYECIHHSGVFAVGDCCHFVSNPRPKAGVFAVRAGPPLYTNIRAYLHYYTSFEQEQQSSSASSSSSSSSCTAQKAKLIPHTPQTNFLGLISTGDKYAIASRGSWFAMEGRLMWKWKDYIDRKWMEQYQL